MGQFEAGKQQRVPDMEAKPSLPDSIVRMYQKDMQISESREGNNTVVVSGVERRAVRITLLPDRHLKIDTEPGSDISPVALQVAEQMARAYFEERRQM